MAAAISKKLHLPTRKDTHTHTHTHSGLEGSVPVTLHCVSAGQAPQFLSMSQSTPCPSDVGAVGGGRRVRLAADLLDVVERGVTGADLAFEHLLVRLPEVLRQEGVDDRVDG